MKVAKSKTYKRKLSKAALDAMSEGGRNGSVEDKREAGKAGWLGLVKKLKGAK